MRRNRAHSLVHCFGRSISASRLCSTTAWTWGSGRMATFAGLVVPSEIRDRLLRMGGLDQAAGLGTLWTATTAPARNVSMSSNRSPR